MELSIANLKRDQYKEVTECSNFHTKIQTPYMLAACSILRLTLPPTHSHLTICQYISKLMLKDQTLNYNIAICCVTMLIEVIQIVVLICDIVE